ncbi:MAG: tetratricopeptide repeat protein [Bacteroidota bacterium]
MKTTKILYILSFLLIAISYFAFSPVKKNDFVNYDDPHYVYENALIKELNFKNIKTIFTTRTSDLYVPLVLLSYSIEHHFFKLDPQAYHLTNLFLHLINCLLVLWLIWLLSKNLLITITISGLFALHLLHVESVAWITERKDVLYALFYLLALLFYHFHNERNSKKYYVFAILFFILSCFSKAMAVTLPAILLLYDYFYLQKRSLKIIINKIPFAVISFVFIIVALKTMNLQGRGANNLEYNLFDKIATASYGLFFYIQKAVLPVNLSVIYSYPEKTGNLLPLIYLISPILVGIIFWLVFFYKKSNPIIKACFLFFIISILPVLQIIPNTFTIAADRYFYLPSLGLFGIAAYLLNKVIEQKKMNSTPAWILVSSTLIIFAVGTYNRCKVWENSITLFSDVIKNYRTSDVAYGNLGLAYNNKGDFKTALPLLEKAASLNPKNSEVLNNYGWALSMTKQYEQAIEQFNRSIAIYPKEPKTYINLGNTYGTIGKFDLSIENFTKALELEPNNTTTLYNLGYTYLNAGNKTKALEYYQRSARLGFKPAQEFLQKNGLSW